MKNDVSNEGLQDGVLLSETIYLAFGERRHHAIVPLTYKAFALSISSLRYQTDMIRTFGSHRRISMNSEVGITIMLNVGLHTSLYKFALHFWH